MYQEVTMNNIVIKIVEEFERKRAIIEKCDSVFPISITPRKNYEEIFSKIDKYAVFLSAYEGEDILGYAAVYVNDEKTKTGYISLLAVLEDRQGRHIGNLLMEGCVAAALEHGMNRIRIEVQKSNTRAIHFYEHWDFEYEKDSDDSIYMIKQLAQ